MEKRRSGSPRSPRPNVKVPGPDMLIRVFGGTSCPAIGWPLNWNVPCADVLANPQIRNMTAEVVFMDDRKMQPNVTLSAAPSMPPELEQTSNRRTGSSKS